MGEASQQRGRKPIQRTEVSADRHPTPPPPPPPWGWTTPKVPPCPWTKPAAALAASKVTLCSGLGAVGEQSGMWWELTDWGPAYPGPHPSRHPLSVACCKVLEIKC